MPWSGTPPQSRIHRVSQAPRRRLPRRHRHRGDPRQPFRPCLARDHELARGTAHWPFTFTFTPTHGSWLNLIEGFFSKLARSVLRHIRVSSKHELKQRLMAFIDDINREPVVHTWRYKIDRAA